MAISVFAHKQREPQWDEILAVLGSAGARWRRLVSFMEATYGLAGASKYYGRSYGWMVWFRRSGKRLLALYP